MYLSTSTSTEDFPEMYLSTFQVLYKLYLSTDVLKYKVLLPGSDPNTISKLSAKYQFCAIRTADTRDGKLTTRGVYPWVVHELSIVCPSFIPAHFTVYPTFDFASDSVETRVCHAVSFG